MCSWEAEREVVLEEEARRLDDRVGVLSLENSGPSKRIVELEVDLVTEGTAKGALEKDVSWILSEGFERVVNRLIESPQFFQGLVHV